MAIGIETGTKAGIQTGALTVAPRRRPFDQLYVRMAAVLLALVLALGVALFVILRMVSGAYQDEVLQRSSAELAHVIAGGAHKTGPGVLDVRSLEELFPYVTMVNPLIEVYVLDRDGRVLAYSGAKQQIALERVDLEPVHAFIERSRPMPIRGTDPRSGTHDSIFSAAMLGADNDPLGFVYVVLGRSDIEAAAMRSSRGYVGTVTLIAVTGALLFALIAGALLFRALTARLQRLCDSVERFFASDFREQPAAAPLATASASAVGNDEIARLTMAFGEMARRILEQLRRLERIDSGRRTAVLNASHDLRTPLTALQGYLQTLIVKRAQLTEQQREDYLEIAHKHATRLHRLVDQMFELAKLDAPETLPRLESFALAELVGDIAQNYTLGAQDRGVALAVDLDAAAPAVSADIAMVERLIENLVENALKFTPAGGRVAIAVRAASPDTVELAVSDTGPGIPADERERVFDRFYRIDPPETGTSSGLGLAIVKRIVDLHGATLSLESNDGGGARFRVRFHAAPPPSPN
jgi:two-component system OmpR family sensor kinase